MSVEIEPQELNFRRPFNVEVSRTLTLRNSNTTPVAFKVKTTAPKQYCVRPNSGRIEPGHDVEVTVLLQAMKVEPPPDAKCRDKFLVQSAQITGDKEFASIANVLETTEKSLLQERKIRVGWLPPSDDAEDALAAGPSAITPNRQSMVNGHEATPDISRAYGSPGDDTAISSAPPPYTDEAETVHREEEQEPERPKISQAVASTKNTAQLTYEELKAKLEKAEAQLAALRENASLRLRKAADTSEKPSAAQVTTAVRQGVEGVSVQMVAILCLISFLLAYFFF